MFPNANLEEKERCLQWHTTKPKADNPIRGFLCGEMRTIEAHWKDNANRPCLRWITSGRVSCYCETERFGKRTIGYVPIETREREQLVIIVPKITARMVKTFVYGSPLEFSCAKREKSPTRCRVCLAEEIGTQRGELLRTERPRDITRYLLEVLWGEPALVQFFAKPQPEPKPAPPSLLRKPRAKPQPEPQPAPSDNASSLQFLQGIGLAAPSVR